MSVVIWKDGESMRCPPKRLQQNLNAGWSLSKEPVKAKAEPKKSKQIEGFDNEAEQSGS